MGLEERRAMLRVLLRLRGLDEGHVNLWKISHRMFTLGDVSAPFS